MINDNIFIFGWSNPLRDYAINSMDNWPVLAHCILQINNKPDKSRLFIKLCGGGGGGGHGLPCSVVLEGCNDLDQSIT